MDGRLETRWDMTYNWTAIDYLKIQRLKNRNSNLLSFFCDMQLLNSPSSPFGNWTSVLIQFVGVIE